MRYAIIVVCMGYYCSIYAQDIADITFSQPNSQQDILLEVDALEYYASNPMNINSSSANEIALLPGISLSLARKIKKLSIDTTLSLHSILMDSSLLLSLDQQSILLLCTIVNDVLHTEQYAPSLHIKQRLRYQITPGNSNGRVNGRFTGSAPELYIRTTGTFDSHKGGLTVAKDSDEPWNYSFMSGFALYNHNSFSIIAGDFIPQSAMGSVMSTGLRFSGGLHPISALETWNCSIKPWTSSMEQQYCRGVALQSNTTYSFGSLHSAIFLSNRNKSATVDKFGTITGFPVSGLYRTITEQASAYKANELQYGGFLECSDSNYKAAITIIGCNYQQTLSTVSTSSFNESSNLIASIAGRYAASHITIQAEFAIDKHGVSGLQCASSYQSDLYAYAIGISMWPENFRSPFGNTIGRYSKPTNQQCLYTAIECKPMSQLFLSAFASIYSSYLPRYGDDFPDSGISASLQARWNISSKKHALLKIYNELSSVTEKPAINHRMYSSLNTQRIHAEFISKTNVMQIIYKVEYTSIVFRESGRKEYGLAGSLQVSGNIPMLDNLHFLIKNTVFAITDFTAAIWFPEPGLPGQISFNPLNGSGIQTTVTASYRMGQLGNISVKMSGIFKPLQKELGSGLDAISSSSRYQYGIQADISL